MKNIGMILPQYDNNFISFNMFLKLSNFDRSILYNIYFRLLGTNFHVPVKLN